MRDTEQRQALHITLQLREASLVEPIASIELSDEDHSNIVAAIIARNGMAPCCLTIGEWMKSAMLHQANRDLASGKPLLAMEDAITKAIGLLTLIASSNRKLRAELETRMDVKLEERISSGVELLADASAGELQDAFNASCDYATRQKVVAA